MSALSPRPNVASVSMSDLPTSSTTSDGAPQSPRGGFFSKSPRESKSPRVDNKSPRKTPGALRKGSAPAAASIGPLQRDTKQQELIQAALAKKQDKKGKGKFGPVSKKNSIPQAVPEPSPKAPRTLNRSGFRPAAVVSELVPQFPNLPQSQILDVLEEEDFNVDASKARLTAMQDAILKSPMMTKSFLKRDKGQFSSDKEESMGSLDTIMQREMANRSTVMFTTSPVQSPIDATGVVEKALMELDDVLNETRLIQEQAREKTVWRDTVLNVEPVVAIEDTEDDIEEYISISDPVAVDIMFKPDMVLHEQLSSLPDEVEVVPQPLAAPKPPMSKRMSVKKSGQEMKATKTSAGWEGPPSPHADGEMEEPSLTMMATPADLIDEADRLVLGSPPLLHESGNRIKRTPPKIVFEPTAQPLMAKEKEPVRIVAGPAPRVGSPAALAEKRDAKVVQTREPLSAPKEQAADKETLLKELLQRGIISEAEYEDRLQRIGRSKRLSVPPPPVPEFPGVEAFGLREEEFDDPLSFDAIMSRPIAASPPPAKAAAKQGVSRELNFGTAQQREAEVEAVIKSPAMPQVTIAKGTVLKGKPAPKEKTCGKCGVKIPTASLNMEVRFCPSCGNKL